MNICVAEHQKMKDFADKLAPGLYAVHYLDNWCGEGDRYHLIGRKQPDGQWINEESNQALLEYEGDAILEVWALTKADQLASLDDQSIRKIAVSAARDCDEQHDYMSGAKADHWEPHKWVTDALRAASRVAQQLQAIKSDRASFEAAVALREARRTLAVAMTANAPSWYKTDEDIAQHPTIEKIDKAMAALIGGRK